MPDLDQDRYPMPTMKEAVYEYELVRRKVGKPILRATGPEKVSDWLRKFWANKATDEMIVLAINNENQVLGYQSILGGDGLPTSGVLVYGLDAVFRPVLQLGMKRFIVAIYQSQNTVPELAGIEEITRATGRIAGMMNIDFVDLMVVAGDEWMSARIAAHGPMLHALAHSILEDLGGTDADHERLDSHEPDDLAWARDVLIEFSEAAPEDVLQRVIERLQPLFEAMAADQAEADGLMPQSSYQSLEDLMSGPEATNPHEETA
jgi:hypothetical protein